MNQNSKNIKYLLLIATLSVVGFYVGSWFSKVIGNAGAGVKIESFTLMERDLHPYVFPQKDENYRVVHFWANWCPPCVEELKEVIQLASYLSEHSIRLILISTDPSWEEANKLLPIEIHPNIIALLDPQASIAKKFGTYQFPETYLVSSNGEVVKKWVGPQKWNSEDLRKQLLLK